MNATQNFETNETFNPLFAKMQERFCANGTIAERMATEAGILKKRSKKASVSRRTSMNKERVGNMRRMIFNLKNCGIASMCVLCLSVLFFSGASIGGLRKSFSATSASASVAQESIVSEEQEAFPAGTAYSLEKTPTTNL
jgi:hypothetical protein